MSLPKLLDRATIQERLQAIFPEGTPNRAGCVSKASSATIYTALYVGAIDGAGAWLNPSHVVRMGDERAQFETSDAARSAYAAAPVASGTRWYQENSRESVRDDTIRKALLEIGAMTQRVLPTTSQAPRYALQSGFAQLFDPDLDDTKFAAAAEAWRAQHLTPAALSRVTMMQHSAKGAREGVLVQLPDGDMRKLVPGPSAPITKAVVEIFAKNFLVNPAVLWISESGNKVVQRDDKLARSLKLDIAADRNLPDVILVDLGSSQDEFLLVFVEIVATDGPMSEERVRAFREVGAKGGWRDDQMAFVTAYADRASAGFKKTIGTLAWGSFAWFMSEPANIVQMVPGDGRKLRLKPLAMR